MTAFLKIQGAICIVFGLIVSALSLFKGGFPPFTGTILVTLGAIAWRVADLKRESAS